VLRLELGHISRIFAMTRLDACSHEEHLLCSSHIQASADRCNRSAEVPFGENMRTALPVLPIRWRAFF
jgi:hypothetical protein